MCAILNLKSALMAIVLAGALPSFGQGQLALPGCEANPEVQRTLTEELDSGKLDKMKFVERITFERKVLADLITKYPREFETYRSLVLTRWENPDAFPVLQERLAKFAQDNPDDPLALTVGGMALANKNTPESIRLLEAAKAKAANFPWPYQELAQVYFSGKRANTETLVANVNTFFALCPGSSDFNAQWLLNKDTAMQPKVAAAMRARLEKETDPKRLKDYETLWGLEFRARPPAEHDALRKQVASDLKHLESLNPKGDAAWLAFLIKGYKQSGTPQETVISMEDRLLSEYPKSNEAFEIVSKRWQNAHKEPEDPADTAAWRKYDQEHRAAIQAWIKDYPDNTYIQRYMWFYTVFDDDSLSEKDGSAALDHFVSAITDYQAPEFWNFLIAAEFLTTHKWQPARAMELATQARILLARNNERSRQDDNVSAEDAKDNAEGEIRRTQRVNGVLLQAARQAGQPDAVKAIRGEIESSPPEAKKLQSDYWRNRGLLAEIENRKQDALTYYQMALQTRVDIPKWDQGKLRDDLRDDARALWKQLGGSEAAWSVWENAPGSSGAALTEGRWEVAKKQMPSFELSDLSGKTWRLKELNGKVLFINVWATWCGPCNAELPRVEKFYEQVKGRSDIQVLTFDVDDNPGMVAPYLKEKGYTFPVLPAYSTLVSLLDGVAIPQNWIVDSKGTWRWTQLGYGGGSDADFAQEMLAKLDSVKSQ